MFEASKQRPRLSSRATAEVLALAFREPVLVWTSGRESLDEKEVAYELAFACSFRQYHPQQIKELISSLPPLLKNKPLFFLIICTQY